MTLDEAKAHLRLDHEDEDDFVASLIETAQAHLDGPRGVLSSVLLHSEWCETFNLQNVKTIELRQSPISSISSVSVGGDLLEPSSYALRHRDTGLSIILLDYAITSDDVQVHYYAGYETPEKIPAPLKHAMKLHIGSLYELRETEVIGAMSTRLPHYDVLIGPYKRKRIG